MILFSDRGTPASVRHVNGYSGHTYKLVKDVRTGYETSDAQGVLDGELDEFLKAFLMEFGGKN